MVLFPDTGVQVLRVEEGRGNSGATHTDQKFHNAHCLIALTNVSDVRYCLVRGWREIHVYVNYHMGKELVKLKNEGYLLYLGLSQLRSE